MRFQYNDTYKKGCEMGQQMFQNYIQPNITDEGIDCRGVMESVLADSEKEGIDFEKRGKLIQICGQLDSEQNENPYWQHTLASASQGELIGNIAQSYGDWKDAIRSTLVSQIEQIDSNTVTEQLSEEDLAITIYTGASQEGQRFIEENPQEFGCIVGMISKLVGVCKNRILDNKDNIEFVLEQLLMIIFGVITLSLWCLPVAMDLFEVVSVGTLLGIVIEAVVYSMIAVGVPALIIALALVVKGKIEESNIEIDQEDELTEMYEEAEGLYDTLNN